MNILSKFLRYSFLVVVLTSCNAFLLKPTQTPSPTSTKLPTHPPSTTPSSTPQPTLPITPTPTPIPACIDVEISSPMTNNQIEYLQGNEYTFIYATDEKSVDDIYSLNKADTVCSRGYPTGNFNVWKVVSGFIVDLDQPDKELFDPGSINTADVGFVNIYAKARFISQEGIKYEYWLQLTGNPPNYWFQLVQWDEPISESTDQPGLTAMGIFATEKNSDGTSSYIDANTMISDGLLEVNYQFVAIIYIGTTNSDSGFQATSATVGQFVDAIEGKSEFPRAPEGFFLPVQAMIVPVRK